ncbi:PTS sugar transporter subunit IIA [uncultured Fibrobacter sp.]|jgi:Phosphotransferase system mannitol/fructose-specific IIA domain (Ntr-type)|uniref:PTS sugar transporter subunit IIA n=1 Tax=uncultured Fibrobacter sp. TaxID=261512 RepID=UPI0025FD89E7|nr:PTS sugar transporter subunit IIA [uncultured Fibrobacter sp.]
MKPISCKFYKETVDFGRALGLAYESLVNSPHEFDSIAAWTKLSERVSQGVYMGDGLLLPHTRIPGLPAPLMAFVVAPEGFSGVTIPGRETARFMCLLLSPAESATVHTQAIAEMARLILDKEWKENALACQSDSEVSNLF